VPQTMTSRPSAIGEVGKQYGVPVLVTLTLDDIVEYLKGLGTEDDLKRLNTGINTRRLIEGDI
jgi:orotate phosphoribosyltransferase